MKNFNKVYTKLLEDMTTASALGTGQVHAPITGQSSDFYAPGDARNIWSRSKTKWKPGKSKKKKMNGEAQPLIPLQRRTFPSGM